MGNFMKTTVKGDLIHLAKEGRFDLIVHGQNCFHGWKKGIAHSIGLNFPAAKKADLATIYGDKKKLGFFSSAEIELDCGKTIVVVNAYTQFRFGEGIHCNLNAIEKSMLAIAKAFPGLSIGYPKIGSGHAGGDWRAISPLIERAFEKHTSTLVIF